MDYTALPPSSLPRELFSFKGETSPITAVQQFALREYRDRSLDNFAPTMLAVLRVPIRHLMSLFKRLIDGQTLSSGELAPVYGSVLGRDLAVRGATATTIIMSRLAFCHDRAHGRYTAALRSWMERLGVQGNGYRFAYKKWLHTATFCGPSLFPDKT
jgi:hypothetical protein